LSDGTALLIVRHGAGRGRLPGYLAPALRRIEERDPALMRAVRFHETGAPAPPALDGVRAVFFWLADPLRELYPDCFAEASAIEADARSRGLVLVNPPSALSNSIKSVQSRIWRAAGVPTPACIAYADRDGLARAVEATGFPLLLKSDQLHAQDRMLFLESRGALRATRDDALPMPGVATTFVDTRAGWVAARPGTPWAGSYHKKRLIVFGDVIQTRNVFFAAQPIVGLSTSTLWRYRPADGRPSRPGFFGLRRSEREEVAADLAYFRGGACEAPELMLRATRALGFGVAAIDYSVHADGRVVLWEANPFHFVPGPKSYVLPVERSFEERYDAFCNALAAFFARLLAAPPCARSTNSA
jgi:hypothetical protein